MSAIVAIVISYLAGSLIFSFFAGKWLKGIDIRQHGSGNAGATNTLRVIGVGPAIAVFVLDIAKGIGAVALGYALSDNEWVPALCGLAAIVGHNWPVFFGFKGGKGIATTVGAMAALSFLPLLYAGLAAIAIIAATRYVSLGSIVLTAALPILLFALGYSPATGAVSLVILLMAVIRHRSNISKLLQGTERKIGSKKPKEGQL